MTIAQNTCDAPLAILLAPDDEKLCGAFANAGLELAELVHALSDCTKALDWVYAQATRNEFAPEVTANVLFGVREHLLSIPRHAASVVIELNIR